MRPSPAITAVLFDLDGTLMDSERHSHEVIAQVLQSLGRPPLRLPDNRVYGCRWIDIARDAVVALGDSSLDPVELAQTFSDEYDRVVFAEVLPIPGAVDAVREAARHLRVGLVTSSPASYATLALDALGLSEVIPVSRRVTGGEVMNGKPAPDPFLLGAQRLGVAAAECVVFEDSAAGLAAARAAGMWRVAVIGATEDHDRLRDAAHLSVRDYHALPAGFWADPGASFVNAGPR